MNDNKTQPTEAAHGPRTGERNALRRRSFAAAAAATLATPWLQAQTQQALRIAGYFPASHSSSVAMGQFKQDLEKEGQGRIQVDLLSEAQLAGQDKLEMVRKGELFLTWVSHAYLSRSVPEFAVLSVPFLFSDRQHAFRVVDGAPGARLAQRMRAQGLELMGFMELGPRQLTSNKPVRSIADFKGLRIRVQPDPVHQATFRALGAEPVTMDIKDVYAALQGRSLDAQENPFAVIRDRKFDQVQKYLANTGHFFDFVVLVAHRGRYEALASAHEHGLRQAVAKAIEAQRTTAAAEDIGAIVDLGARGMVFEPVRNSTRDEMQKATAGVIDQLRQKLGDELVSMILKSAR